MKRVIVITSGKGGVGKTTTAINLGAAMNHFGEDVLILDGNLSTPNIGLHLNSPEVPVDLNQVLQEKADAFEAVYEHESGIKVVPSSLSIKELKRLEPEKIKEFKKDFLKISDYVIVDSAAGLGHEAQAVMDMADELIVVTNPEIAAVTDALKTIKLAEQKKKTVLGVIVARVRQDDIEMEPEAVKDMLEVPFLGMVPEDIHIPKSLKLRDAVVHTHPKSKPARAYKEIAAQILGIDYNPKREKEGFFEKLLGKFGFKNKKKR
ncbi:P-loop NTPase [Candidatus Pacearchaeota archaeon]|nr:P-loop NTPase [Candidatus Pacearchaeota archaeon]